MSRTGSKVINIDNVEISLNEVDITIKGKLGVMNVPQFKCLSVDIKENKLTVNRLNNLKTSRQKHGLFRSLLFNAVQGVSEGYKLNMYLQGIGYRVQKKGNDLEFSLGYSHPVLFKALEGVEFSVDGQNKFSVLSINKELVGQVCADIKKLRKRDAYKGKGIFFENEVPRKKPGKSIKK
ncbi:50S ribosomal protein L6 [Candidatus Marinamargulisbacteria bacterium SCGC AG-343-D04]|nr:50S ribosomal protein L6 [Candidatus Marinamargulisbacteria bacterium SCGC AG-343-D04]